MPLEFKPEPEQASIVYSSAPQDCFPGETDKVFAVIGPFENFDDKPELQRALKMLLRGWNIKSDSE
jgi:hypothetical protein